MIDEDMKILREALSEFSPSTPQPLTKPKVEEVVETETKSTKRAKSKVKTERQIRARRKELFQILDEAEGNVPYKECVEGILAEFTWILGEEKETKKISKKAYERKIAKLEKENRELDVQNKLLGRGN